MVRTRTRYYHGSVVGISFSAEARQTHSWGWIRKEGVLAHRRKDAKKDAKKYWASRGAIEVSQFSSFEYCCSYIIAALGGSSFMRCAAGECLLAFALVVCASVSAFARFDAVTDTPDEQALRQLVHRLFEAYRHEDLDGVTELWSH